jgi:hypothetical protein
METKEMNQPIKKEWSLSEEIMALSLILPLSFLYFQILQE